MTREASSPFLGIGSMGKTSGAEFDVLSIIHLLLTQQGNSAKILASNATFPFSIPKIGWGPVHIGSLT